MRKFPEYQKHIYKVNEVSRYYEKILAPVGFIKLPFDLRLETPHRPDYKSKTKFILSGRIVNGKKTIFSGLIPTGVEGLFYADHFHPSERVKNSFMLLRFNATSSEIEIFYFNHFTVFPKTRESFIQQFLNTQP
jgi:hypothetical protein